MGPTWGRQDPGWPHVGHMNLAIWDNYLECKHSIVLDCTAHHKSKHKKSQKANIANMTIDEF